MLIFNLIGFVIHKFAINKQLQDMIFF